MTETNDTTRQILNFLFTTGTFCWRQNVAPIPILRGGKVIGFRSGGKSGLPDIVGIFSAQWPLFAGKFLGVEIKTGRDRLRPEQEGFHASARSVGAVILVVKDFADFQVQWNDLVRI